MVAMLVAHVAHNARLDERVEGFPVRDHMTRRLLRLEATKGTEHPETVKARREVEGPPAPDALAYLLQWSWELYGRSGIGMHGFAPLSFTTIRDWATLTDRAVEPHEVHALLMIDAVRRNPPKVTETDDG